MKKILVTGATGFIGNYVIQGLLKNPEYSVIATSSNLLKAQTFDWFQSVKYIPLDLENLNTDVNYYEYFGMPDLLIHLAWEGLPNYKFSFHVEVNLPRHAAFLTNCILNGLKDITIIGTCFEYGLQEGCLSEDLVTQPNNFYAIAKDNLRKKIQELNKEINFHFKWVRLFYTYGKGQSSNSLLSQLESALEKSEPSFSMSAGEQQRDYLPVEKVVENIIKIAIQNKVLGVVNCCSGEPISVKQFVINYLKQKKSTIQLNLGYYPYSDYEPMHFWGDNKKLKKIIGYE